MTRRHLFDWAARPDLVGSVREWLGGSGSRPDELAMIEGRVDLRGFPLGAAAVQLGAVDAHAGPVWDSLDLREARLDNLRLFGLTMRDCRFEGASCRGWRTWGITVEGCSFVGADLRRSALGSGEWMGPDSCWVETSLARANLSDASFRRARLDRCTFDSPSGLGLIDCLVHECTFSGILRKVIIDGRSEGAPLVADLRASVFRDAQIIGHRITDVALPEQSDLRLIRAYPAVVRRGLELLANPSSDVEERAAGILGWIGKAPGQADSDWCFDIGSFSTREDPGLSECLDDLLSRAIAAES